MQQLAITRSTPTPTTVKYTVTTRPTGLSWKHTFRAGIVYLQRAASIALICGLVLLKVYAYHFHQVTDLHTAPSNITDTSEYVPTVGEIMPVVGAQISRYGCAFIPATQRLFFYNSLTPSIAILNHAHNMLWFSIHLDVAILLSTVLIFLSFFKRLYVEESVLVVRGLGIQLCSSGTTILSQTSDFIPVELIDNVILHEGFKRFSVMYFMAVIVKNHDRLLLVFPVC